MILICADFGLVFNIQPEYKSDGFAPFDTMPDYDALEVIRDIIQENNLKLNDKELTNKIKKKLNVRHWTVSDDEILISFIDEIRKQDHATEPLSSLLTRDSTLRINSILEPLDITSSDEDEDDDKNDKDDNKYNHDDILELFEEIMSPILKDCKGLKQIKQETSDEK